MLDEIMREAWETREQNTQNRVVAGFSVGSVAISGGAEGPPSQPITSRRPGSSRNDAQSIHRDPLDGYSRGPAGPGLLARRFHPPTSFRCPSSIRSPVRISPSTRADLATSFPYELMVGTARRRRGFPVGSSPGSAPLGRVLKDTTRDTSS